MSVDRRPKRKTIAKRDAVSPQPPSQKKGAKSRTADDLEALLQLLDEDDTSAAALKSGRALRETTSGDLQKPARETAPAADESSSFMQELARARAELHKERRSRIALTEEVELLQAAVQREAAARRRAEAVHTREAAAALFEAEQQIERLSRELAANQGVEAASQQNAARQAQQVKQELEKLRRRLVEIEQGPGAS